MKVRAERKLKGPRVRAERKARGTSKVGIFDGMEGRIPKGIYMVEHPEKVEFIRRADHRRVGLMHTEAALVGELRREREDFQVFCGGRNVYSARQLSDKLRAWTLSQLFGAVS